MDCCPSIKAQLISYLKATGNKLGLLVNFNERLVRDGIQRVVFS
ncbi:MAG TPA: GxxExxY protein [Novimethylophilus sp.]